MTVCFLATGDLHIGAGARYGRTPGERLAEQEACWQRILEIADEEQVDAVLVAGDVFEGPLPTPEHYLAFTRPLAAAPCPVLAILGNGRHDAAMRDSTALDVLSDRLTVHSRPGVWQVPDTDVSVATLPWAPVSRIVAAENGGDRDRIHEHAADLLLTTARGLREQIDGPAVLLAHWSISGATLPGGMTSDQLREVVLPQQELAELGFDAIVAGHLHPPQVLRGDSDHGGQLHAGDRDGQLMFYVGSPMPLNFGEAGERGVWLLEGPPFTAQFRPLISRRFVTLDEHLSAHDAYGLEVALASFDVFDAYVRVRLHGTAEEFRSVVDRQRLRHVLDEASAHNVWFEDDVQREARARVEGLDETVDDTAALDAWLETQDVNGVQAPALRERHGAYLEEAAR